MPTSIPPDYIDKYLQTQIINGQLQIVNASGKFVYQFAGGDTLHNVTINLPILPGDDTMTFAGIDNNWIAPQTFVGLLSTLSGIRITESPDPSVNADLLLDDGINIECGSDTGTNIGTDPAQKIGFFGVPTTIQPQATDPTSTDANLIDLWNACISLGLINGSTAVPIIAPPPSPSSTINVASPSVLGGRWGLYQGASASSPPVGQGLLTQLSTTPSNNSVSSTFINNRPATNFVSGSSTGNYGGFRTSNAICTPSLNPSLTAKIALSTNTNSRIYLGFASSSSLTTGFNTVLNNISGFMIGFGSSDTNYSVVTNNGGAAQTNNTTNMPLLQTAGLATVFTLSWDNPTTTLTWGIQVSGDSSVITGTINTGLLPAAGSQLYLYCTTQTNASSSVTLTVEDVEILLGNDFNVF